MTSSPLQRNSRELSRRRFLRGTGVVMALPWLESLPVWGAEPTAARPRPKRLARSVHGQRRQPDAVVGQGIGRRRWSWARAWRRWSRSKAKFNYINGLFNKAATGVGIHPGMTGNLLSGAPLHEGRRAARRRQPGSGAGQPHRRADGAAEHGPGLRAADHRLPRDELLDGLQLAHLVVRARRRRCRWRSIRRWRSTACSRTAAASAT